MHAFAGYLHAFALRHRYAVFVAAMVMGIAVTGQGTDLVSLLASSASSLSGSSTIVYFAPQGEDTLKIGETAKIDVRVNTDVPINVIGTTILFPTDEIEIVGISKEGSFMDLWTEDTSIKEESGEIRFSGGTLAENGLTGIGTAVTLTVKAKKAGRAELSFKDLEVFAHDGTGKAVRSTPRSFAYAIDDAIATERSESTPESMRASADFNNDGRISLADMSILAIQLLSPHSTRYDLDRSGAINLTDLSIFFADMR